MDVDSQHEQAPTAFAQGNASVLPSEPLQEDAYRNEMSLTGGTFKPQYKLRHILSGHTRSIASLKFSPDGSMLASCGVSLCIQIYEKISFTLEQSCGQTD